MSLLVQAQTSDDDDEIRGCLQLVLNASPLGLIHESVNVNYRTAYTRKFCPLFGVSHGIWLTLMVLGSWFAWANGVFAETILNLAKRKPHLIFTDPKPYEL